MVQLQTAFWTKDYYSHICTTHINSVSASILTNNSRPQVLSRKYCFIVKTTRGQIPRHFIGRQARAILGYCATYHLQPTPHELRSCISRAHPVLLTPCRSIASHIV
jgi:hypothetical protein